MFNGAFWKSTAERAVKTGAQAALALVGVAGLGVLDIDWAAVGSVSALAAIASVLTSIVSAPVGEVGTPSLTETGPAEVS